jgi:hypothetical protein
MSIEQQFIAAGRAKLRFSTTQGSLPIEDLWDMSLATLDTIAKHVNKLLRDEGEESFLPSTSNKPASLNDLRLEILKHIIDVKVQEDENRKLRAERMAKINQLQELIAQKAVEELEGKSVKELTKEIDKLKALV